MREKIPSDIKRNVRKKCGFGCVLCGCPIYDYDHIVDYAKVHEHTEENLVLLCPTCHRKKTNKLVNTETIISAIKTAGERTYTSPEGLPMPISVFNIGNNQIRTKAGSIFVIPRFGELHISFNGELLINGYLCNGDGRKALSIENNIYTLHSQTWDIEYVGSVLTFRDGLRKVFASLNFSIAERTLHLTGKAKISDEECIEITSEGIFYKGHLLASHNVCYESFAGLVITDQPIVHGHWASGKRCNHNTFIRARGIAMLNCIECHSNLFYHNEYAMIWTTQFLENFGKT